MKHTFFLFREMARKLTFILVPLALVAYLVYSWVSSLPEVSPLSDPDVEVTSKNGEELFWGRGRCHVCHRIGERGYALRGPNLGDGKDGAIIPLRAQQRALQLGLTGGTDYLIQCVIQPGAFVVPGYSNEMPEVHKAPISLFPSEITAVIYYLKSLDGHTSSVPDIHLPLQLMSAFESPAQPEFRVRGDVATGRDLFFDSAGPAACASCHVGLDAEGDPRSSAIGPDLTSVAAIRTARYLYDKIVNPDSNVVSGYQEVLVKTRDGRFLVGVIEEESSERVRLLQRDGQITCIDKGAIATLVLQDTSKMPANYAELLDEKQIHDLVAYLLTLRGRLED